MKAVEGWRRETAELLIARHHNVAPTGALRQAPAECHSKQLFKRGNATSTTKRSNTATVLQVYLLLALLSQRSRVPMFRLLSRAFRDARFSVKMAYLTLS